MMEPWPHLLWRAAGSVKSGFRRAHDERSRADNDVHPSRRAGRTELGFPDISVKEHAAVRCATDAVVHLPVGHPSGSPGTGVRGHAQSAADAR